MNLEDAEDRRRALTVVCRWCRAPIGELCVRSDGQPVQNAPAHTPRLADAGVIHAPLDSRDLRHDPDNPRRPRYRGPHRGRGRPAQRTSR